MSAAKGFNMIYYVEDDDNIRDLTVYALHKRLCAASAPTA